MDNIFTDSVDRLLAQIVTPDVIRAIQEGGSVESLWQELEDSGFLDALLPEESDGAGLSRAESFTLLLLAGQYAAPVPFEPTITPPAWLDAPGVKATAV